MEFTLALEFTFSSQPAKHILKGENYKKENKLILLPRQQQYY